MLKSGIPDIYDSGKNVLLVIDPLSGISVAGPMYKTRY